MTEDRDRGLPDAVAVPTNTFRDDAVFASTRSRATDLDGDGDGDVFTDLDGDGDGDVDSATVLTRKSDSGVDIPVVDFGSYEDAVAQADAIGNGASVEAIGTAYHVVVTN